MSRHVVATLFIGLAVSATLVGLYQTPLFFHVGWWVFGLYEGTFLEVEPALLPPLQYGIIILFAYGAAWVAVDTLSLAGRAVIGLFAALSVVALSPTFAIYGKLFEPLSGVIAMVLGLVAGSIYARSEAGKRRHDLRALLGGRASPSLIRYLSEAKDPVRLDSVTRPAAALTCRIINHGELASSLPPEVLAKMTRRFHALCCGHLVARGGILDADSPDCTRSYFGLVAPSRAPVPTSARSPSRGSDAKRPKPKPNRKRRITKKSDPTKEPAAPTSPETLEPEKHPPAPKPEAAKEMPAASSVAPAGDSRSAGDELATAAVAACHAALELAPHLHNLSRECESETGHRLVAGIGIEGGPVTTCLVGEGDGQRLGAVGSLADFTLRLSAANVTYGSDILIGPAAFHAAREAIEVRPMEMLYDPSANHLSEIYELVDEKGLLSEDGRARCQAFWEGVILLRQDLPEDALEKFSRAKDGKRHDPPLAFFIEKAKSLRAAQKSGQGATPAPPRHARNTSAF